MYGIFTKAQSSLFIALWQELRWLWNYGEEKNTKKNLCFVGTFDTYWIRPPWWRDCMVSLLVIVVFVFLFFSVSTIHSSIICVLLLYYYPRLSVCRTLKNWFSQRSFVLVRCWDSEPFRILLIAMESKQQTMGGGGVVEGDKPWRGEGESRKMCIKINLKRDICRLCLNLFWKKGYFHNIP